jgi:hypothetical protein
MGTNPNNLHDDPNDINDPLADNMRFSRNRPARRTQPNEVPPNPGPHNRRSMVDNDFTNRAQVRQRRQPTSPFSTRQIDTEDGGSDNIRKLLIFGGALVALALVFVLFQFFSRLGGDDLGLADQTPTPDANIEASPGAIAGGAEEETPEPTREPEPTPIPEPLTQTFVVTGTEGTGLNLRPNPSTDGEPIGTLPDGTIVDGTGEEVVNDGTRDWRQVNAPTYGEGWVADEFLQRVTADDDATDTTEPDAAPETAPEATPGTLPQP